MTVPVVDLFAGAGGSAAGAALAGAAVRLSVEIDPVACETLRRNSAVHGGSVLERDVCLLSGDELRASSGLSKRDPLIITGGPPCQPFSKAAYWTDPGDDSRYRRARAKGIVAERPSPIFRAAPDSRRDLLDDFARLIIESRATGFVFENVPSIQHPRNRRTFARFRARLEEADYRTLLIHANSAQFGVPQVRRRIILLGLKKLLPAKPQPTHRLVGEKHAPGLFNPPTAGEALRPYRRKEFSEPEEIVSGRWANELREIPPGMNYKALTAWAGHRNPVFEAETRFWSFLLKLHPERPSWTIAANPGPWVGPFHWSSRRLRTVEMAALQSFPSGYSFAGSRRDRVRQIGNAMPPLLAAAVLRPLLCQVDGRT